jgi:hypothetical protein
VATRNKHVPTREMSTNTVQLIHCKELPDAQKKYII